jgi:hypothetical protein
MSNVEEILRESIENKCGLGGLMRFNALYTGSFETADGRPDLPGIGAAINGAFPADQAATIMAAVTRKIDSGRQPAKGHAAATHVRPGSESRVVPQAFAKYFDADPNNVLDIVNEARRMRAAMGKSMPSQWAPHSDRAIVSEGRKADAPAETALAEKVTEIKTAVGQTGDGHAETSPGHCGTIVGGGRGNPAVRLRPDGMHKHRYHRFHKVFEG